MLAFEDNEKSPAVIKVIGIGGAGMNALERISELQLKGVELIAMNTDQQVLDRSSADTKVALGNKNTRGLGAGANPEIGEKAAMEAKEQIKEVLSGADMVFITAGMGGGTGTGASPITAEIASELGVLTVGVVTLPFKAEGLHKKEIARKGQSSLRSKVDTLITIPNDAIFKVIDRKTSLPIAFRTIDDVLAKSVIGISDIINSAGDVNVDFADVKKVMSNNGDAVIGVGEGKGEDRVSDALEQAVNHPLLEGRRIDGATAVLINVVSGGDIGIFEYNEILEALRRQVSEHALIINGFREDHTYEDKIVITVIATGFNKKTELKDPSIANNSLADPQKPPALRKIEGGVVSKPESHLSSNVETGDQQNFDFPNIDVTERNFNIPAFLRKK